MWFRGSNNKKYSWRNTFFPVTCILCHYHYLCHQTCHYYWYQDRNHMSSCLIHFGQSKEWGEGTNNKRWWCKCLKKKIPSSSERDTKERKSRLPTTITMMSLRSVLRHPSSTWSSWCLPPVYPLLSNHLIECLLLIQTKTTKVIVSFNLQEFVMNLLKKTFLTTSTVTSLLSFTRQTKPWIFHT